MGEIRIFAGNFAPSGWAFCDGRLLPISEYDALFNLIGTTYGGDGQNTFAVPNLQGRIPLNTGTGKSGRNYSLGETGGVETVTVTTQQLPQHSHAFLASTDLAGQSSPSGNVMAQLSVAGSFTYIAGNASLPLAPNSITPTGGNQPHENIMPYQCLNYIIALYGIYPSPN